MDVDAFLARARSMLGRQTVYWAGCGGRQPLDALASEAVNPGRQWRALSEPLQLRYAPLKSRFDLTDAGLLVMAADCSGYVCWALGFSRQGSPASYTDAQGAIYTDSIYADAMGRSALAPGQAQRRFERVPEGSVAPGCLLVYKKPEHSSDPYGHIGIVVEAAAGRASAVLHCSADNYLSSGDAIRITGTGPFDDPALASIAIRLRAP